MSFCSSLIYVSKGRGKTGALAVVRKREKNPTEMNTSATTIHAAKLRNNVRRHSVHVLEGDTVKDGTGEE